MGRIRQISLIITLLLLCANLALLVSVGADEQARLNDEESLELPPEGTWDFGAGARYNPGSASIDALEKVIVILAETTDEKFTPTRASYDNLLFGDSMGSMSHYFAETTYGFTDMTGIVIGPVRLPNSLYYYDDGSNHHGRIDEAIADAIDAADPLVDFSPFDQDGDGFVDNFMVIFAGPDDSTNGDDDRDGDPFDAGAIWPHKSTIPSHSTDDGVSVSRYFTCAETCGLGTYAHEIAHNFGLPDLYDYGSDGTNSAGIGEWGLMGSGGYLKTSDGPNPAHLSAWAKQEIGVLNPTLVDPSIDQSITLYPASTTAQALKIPITSDEYYLIEFRSKSASDYDAGLHSTGVLIWHIDEAICASTNRVNDDENRPCVRLIQADGNMDLDAGRYRGDAGDSWQEGSAFNSGSNPAARAYSGDPVDIQMTITEVTPSYAVVHFGSFTAWFFAITAEPQDSNGDGFKNEILFTYDPDTDGSSEYIKVQFDFYSADRQTFSTTFEYFHTIQGNDLDVFETTLGYYNGYANGLWWVEARLWIGESMTDIAVFGNIWIEYPSNENPADDWLESVVWTPQDTTGDGYNDSLRVDFDTSTSGGGGSSGDVYLQLYSDENVSSRHSITRTDLDWDSHSITLDMRDTSLVPGILRANLILYVDNQREHVATGLTLDLWWDSVRLGYPMAISHDLDGDGASDSIEVRIEVDHSLRTDTPVRFEVNGWNMTEFDGFTSMQEVRNIPLGPISEGGSGGRGEHTFWLYAEWTQVVTLEVRAILPDGTDFVQVILWDEVNGVEGFTLQPLDWPVTAWQTDHQLLDNDGDGEQDMIRVRYDLDSVSEGLDVAVELLVDAPLGQQFSVWDNYTIKGDAYDLRTLEFPTWMTGTHGFTLRVHDLSDGEVEYEESIGSFALSSAFEPPTLTLSRTGEVEAIRGSTCLITADLEDPIGDFFGQRGEIVWNGNPFEPAVETTTLDCSQWPDGQYFVSANYANGLGIVTGTSVFFTIASPPPTKVEFDLSGVSTVAGEACVVSVENRVTPPSSTPADIERYEWRVDGMPSNQQGDEFDCSELPAGRTTVQVIAHAIGGTSDTAEVNVVRMPEATTDGSDESLQTSAMDVVETKTWGIITAIVFGILALIAPVLLFRRRKGEYDEDEGEVLWEYPTATAPATAPPPPTTASPVVPVVAAPPPPTAASPVAPMVTAPPPQQAVFEEVVDADGVVWREYQDGHFEYFDQATQRWIFYQQ
jgi:M6 family metalloprotease-like protein